MLSCNFVRVEYKNKKHKNKKKTRNTKKIVDKLTNMYYHKNIKTLLYFYSEKEAYQAVSAGKSHENRQDCTKNRSGSHFVRFCMHPAQKEDCNNENDKRFKEKSGTGGKPE